ncbi:MAG: insulinase family protein [Acidimicrobiales bacterium]|nr:insulinase family protein [Acidimicrobiales bacterium]HRW38121.1 pitrilysin family protein [Aquihabitans sp.]
MSVERTDLDSGLTVVTETMAGARSASFGCWVRVGARDERDELAGASHFLEHLLFKGTESRTGREVSEAIESVGGELNAHTSHEHTAFYARVPASAADLGLELLREVVTTPAFDADDVESERQVILEELHLAEDEGDDRVHSLAHEALWGDHPLGREVLGTLETIDSLERDAIAEFFAHHYQPANLVLVAAGAVDHARVVAAGRRFGDGEPGERPARVAPAGPIPRRSHALLRRPSEQAHLCVAWPALAAGDPDRYALGVGNQIFGGGLASRLFQEIREERGLAYSVFSSVTAFSDAGSLVTYAGTGAERAAEVRELVLEQAADLVAHGVTEREWEVARGYLEGSFLLGLEDTGSVMARLGNHVCSRGRVVPVDQQLDQLRAVTPDDVHRAVRRILGADPVVCGVGPLTEADLGTGVDAAPVG